MSSPPMRMVPADGREETGDQLEQRGLAGAARSHDGDELAPAGREVEAHRHAAELECDAGEFEQRRAHAGALSSCAARRSASSDMAKHSKSSTSAMPAASLVR